MTEIGRKAVVMLSGGLDSTLALSLTKKLGYEPVALSLKTPFCNFDCGGGACAGDVSDVARRQGVEWYVRELGEEYIAMVRNPRHGRGAGMNPCIDCRVMMFREGKRLMEEIGADFIVTGEVVGQRPMSQNLKAMEIIENESGLKGKILRPLSAKLLEPTDAEKRGEVDRAKLLAIAGRSRREQIRLAKELGIGKYPNSGGGCILTEKAFSARLRDLFQYSQNVTRNDIEVLKIGRHFRLKVGCKLVVGRNMVENQELSFFAREDDVLMAVRDYVGPTCLIQGDYRDKARLAAGICVRYSDAPRNSEVVVKFYRKDEKVLEEMVAIALDDREIESLRI